MAKIFLNERRFPTNKNAVSRGMRDLQRAIFNIQSSFSPTQQSFAQKGLTATGKQVARNKVADITNKMTEMRQPADFSSPLAKSQEKLMSRVGSTNIREEFPRGEREAYDAIREKLQAQSEAEKAFREFDVLTSAQVSHQGKTEQEVQAELEDRARRRDLAEQAFLDKQARAIALGAEGADVSKGGIPTGGIRRGEKVTAEDKGMARDIREERLATAESEAESARLKADLQRKYERGEQLTDKEQEILTGDVIKEVPVYTVDETGTIRDEQGNVTTNVPSNAKVVPRSIRAEQDIAETKRKALTPDKTIFREGKTFTDASGNVINPDSLTPEQRKGAISISTATSKDLADSLAKLLKRRSSLTDTQFGQITYDQLSSEQKEEYDFLTAQINNLTGRGVTAPTTTATPEAGLGETVALEEFNLGKKGLDLVLKERGDFENVIMSKPEQAVDLKNFMDANNIVVDLGQGVAIDIDNQYTRADKGKTAISTDELNKIMSGDTETIANVVERASGKRIKAKDMVKQFVAETGGNPLQFALNVVAKQLAGEPLFTKENK